MASQGQDSLEKLSALTLSEEKIPVYPADAYPDICDLNTQCASAPPQDEPPIPRARQNVIVTDISISGQATQIDGRIGLRSVRKMYSSQLLGAREKMQQSVTKHKWRMSGLLDQTVGKAHTAKEGFEDRMKDYSLMSMKASLGALKRLDHMMASIDEGLFIEKDQKGTPVECPLHPGKRCAPSDHQKKIGPQQGSCVSKVDFYANSRLPADLPLMQIKPSEYSLVRLALDYCLQTYRRSDKVEEHSYVAANLRRGTKAMALGTHPIDDMDMIVLAIRGTQSFWDWAVNFRTEPKSPEKFLDDPSNFVHAGFLSAAKKMIQPISQQLRSLIFENRRRENYSLLITGHSAGGAVAALLYCHMMSTTTSSDLAYLGSYLKRIHCVTFGAPPSAVRPLHPTPSPEAKESTFYSFINEGDPVARADIAYARSLLSLYASPAPFSPMSRKKTRNAIWDMPPAPLSLAGNLVVLRVQRPENDVPLEKEQPQSIEACAVTDDVVRQTLFGIPEMHMMGVYGQRIEELQKRAVSRDDCLQEPHSPRPIAELADKSAVRKIDVSPTGRLPPWLGDLIILCSIE